MPHICARCAKVYDDGASELISGCDCGSRVFAYKRGQGGKKPPAGKPDVKKPKVTKKPKKKPAKEPASKDLEWIDKEYGDKLKKAGKTVSFDVANMERVAEGRFQLDVGSLMSGKPVVVKAEEGVYYIDLPQAMKKRK